MTNTKKYPDLFALGVLLLALTSFSLSSKTADKSKLLIGRWLLRDFKTPELEKNFASSGMSAERRQALMLDYVEGSYLHFREDGTYEVSILGSQPEVRRWQLSEDDTRLLVRSQVGEATDEIEIEVLTKTSLVLVIPRGANDYLRMFFAAEGS